MEPKGFFGRLFDLSFNEFITTKIITTLFVIAIIASGFGGLAVLVALFARKTLMGVVGGLILGPLAFFFYVILARIWLETLIVLFRIAENTSKMIKKDNP